MLTTREVFAGHKLRCTCQRRALYEALVQNSIHPTAEELFQFVKPRTNRLSRATVYNTLETLCKIGLARKLPSGDGSCRYDSDTSEHLHICFREDGKIRDVPSELGSRLIDQLPRSVIEEIESRLGVAVDGLNIQLLARRCRS